MLHETLMYLKSNFTDLAPVFRSTAVSQRRPILQAARPLQVLSSGTRPAKSILKTSRWLCCVLVRATGRGDKGVEKE